jgi:hypothetical protein
VHITKKKRVIIAPPFPPKAYGINLVVFLILKIENLGFFIQNNALLMLLGPFLINGENSPQKNVMNFFWKLIITIIETKNIKTEQHAKDHATCERNDVNRSWIHEGDNVDIAKVKVLLIIIIFIDNKK